jgi:hypothetical protein
LAPKRSTKRCRWAILALLVLVERGLLGLPGLLFLDEVVVVAVVVVQAPAAQFEHAGAEGVEEGAVVGDDHQAAGVTREVVLEPEQRLEIEVVGGLVEQQQCGLRHEEAGEVRTHHPAAGERARRQVGIALLEAEAGEDLLRAGLQRVVDVEVVVGGFETLPAGGDVEDRLVAGRGAFLRQEAEVGPALPLDRAGVGLLLAEDEVEEGRLAGAVGAHEPQAVGARDEQRHLREEFAGAVGLGNIGDRQHGSRRRHRVGRGASRQASAAVANAPGRVPVTGSEPPGRVAGGSGAEVPGREFPGRPVFGHGEFRRFGVADDPLGRRVEADRASEAQ